MKKITGNEPINTVTDNGELVFISYLEAQREPCATGLTIRQHFASMAMQGLLTCVPESFSNTSITRETIASDAVKMADALMTELNK